MALSKTVNTPHGFQAVDAYHRVEAVQLKGKTEIGFCLRSYTSPDKPFFQEELFSSAYDLNGDNPIEQAYKYLKTLPEFENAKDC